MPWIDGFSPIDSTTALSGGLMSRPTMSTALATNSRSALAHQDLRPDRSIFCARRNRQRYCA